jgi:serine/threonine protein kinase
MPYEDYTKLRKLGQGSFGSIFLVQDWVARKPYVMKEVDLSHMNEQGRLEALKEVGFLSQLNHPNIISYKEFFKRETAAVGRGQKQKRVLYIIMEYADGGDLSQRIKQQRGFFSESQITEWLTQICLCLKHMHDRKILHRDIKSENVFLTKDHQVKLGDFGISKNLAHTFALAHTRIGTPYYLSPEICLNKPYDTKNDMWALGVVIYESMSLKHPFDADSMEKLLDKIVRGRPASLPRQYSQQLRDVVDWLLKKDPRKRPSVNELLKVPFIKDEVAKFLSPDEEREEFSHTILHKYNNNKPAPAVNENRRRSKETMDRELETGRGKSGPSVPGVGVKRRDRDSERDREEGDGRGLKDDESVASSRRGGGQGQGRPRTPSRRIMVPGEERRAPPSPAVGIKRMERDHDDRDAGQGRNAGRRAYPSAGPPPSGDMGMSINAAPWREDRGRLGSRRGNRAVGQGQTPVRAAHHEVARREREDQLANIRLKYFQERKEARERMLGTPQKESRGGDKALRSPGRNHYNSDESKRVDPQRAASHHHAAANPFPTYARPGRRRMAPGGGRDAIDDIMRHDDNISGDGMRVAAGPQHGRRRNY